jgi:hypothetical protein
MTTKLTLSIDDHVVDSAKKYAKGKGKSLSGLIENYLRSITIKTSKEESDEELPPVLRQLRGSLKLPRDFDYKKELTKALAKKYTR